MYCGSADWMPRNLFERCEVVFPIRDPQIRNRIRKEILAAYLADTAKSRMETATGNYARVKPVDGKRFNAQDFFIRLAEGRDSVDDIPPPASEAELPPAVKAPGRPKAQRRKTTPKPAEATA